ncbi:MAG TPA: ABC transporter substrate-binding protein [Chthoniobacteraceae bacterium]|jgi:NitT/TauT family transport system substrate-binding protein|nr:ABC transporter substrate-binding protein [Chthoniobacteraceae bacterium]
MKKLILMLLACGLALSARAEPLTLRVGHFPNVTHVQALVAQALSRQGKGWFEQRLGPGVKIEWYSYNAGPSAMEGLLDGTVDLTYVGPSPALNIYCRSGGREIRIVSGAARGGSALVVQPDENLKTPADFRGKRIATPQLGNTQDVACRAWLTAGGLHITQLGGDAQVIPTENPDQLTLFKLKKIDAAWTVEPWVSRLEMEAGGKVLVDDTASPVTVLATGVKFLGEHKDIVEKFVAAHKELTAWIQQHPGDAQKLVVEELAAETHGKIPADLIAHAWNRIVLTNDVTLASLQSFVDSAKAAGFLRQTPDLSQILVHP